MSGAQNAAVADVSGEVERQRHIAEYERQQQDITYSQQLELVRQNAESMLHAQAQSHREEAASMLHEQAQSHREETSIVLGHVNILTETTLNKHNKQSQERQQMAANGERTRQRIIAHRNQVGNQEKEQDSPDRAKPKAKSEPFKFKAIDNVESGIKDKPNQKTAGDPETTHEPKGPRGRPTNIRRTIENNKKPLHDTEKDENRTRTHWRRATKGYLVDQFAKDGWNTQKPKADKMQNVHKKNWDKL